MIKRFEVGGQYRCTGLYGGEYVMKVVERTDKTISFIYDEEYSDDQSVHKVDIIMQTSTVYDEDLKELGTVETESAVAWAYCSPYAKNIEDVDYGYYFAFDFSHSWTKEEWEAEERKASWKTDKQAMMDARTLRDRLKLNYEKYYKSWKGNFEDDRQVFCNTYDSMMDATFVMQGVTNTFVWSAFRKQFVKDDEFLEGIKEGFINKYGKGVLK